MNEIRNSHKNPFIKHGRKPNPILLMIYVPILVIISPFLLIFRLVAIAATVYIFGFLTALAG